ncbi:golgi apparatus membrane protein-like protein tvp23 [Pseudovirgaria hyperparasitica]|uniref:Golgi apparatus membrane protein TVP23 n=1 Tax=Pseudovirgaria hyperparasitica TaxID=470096 RepID=A0A6A6VX51_9PEZI|nr:golgi apparatus membrane protein-like protein tvp23 [Pseudovirgaria hyperparasitica]KAF2754220.1 golgi apparatus membrane protein-like protein tvp23 [Pseudovirgaria hyperparasitica]
MSLGGDLDCLHRSNWRISRIKEIVLVSEKGELGYCCPSADFNKTFIASRMENPQPEGILSWRLSSHPITLLCFLGFRISSLLVYLLGGLFTGNYVLIFIITIILLAMDFYYSKNIAGRRLVGLRWWNEVDTSSGDSSWVFESADPSTRVINATDRRFFWLALYAQPFLWVVLAFVAIVYLEPIWLTLVVIALVLTITNTLAFSRCDKFSQATNYASSALYSGGLARNIAGGMVSRFFTR